MTNLTEWSHGNHGCHLAMRDGKNIGSVMLQRGQNRPVGAVGRTYYASIWCENDDGSISSEGLPSKGGLKYKEAMAYVENYETTAP